jgi:hypothetical protein
MPSVDLYTNNSDLNILFQSYQRALREGITTISFSTAPDPDNQGFHTVLIEAPGNRVLIEFIGDLRDFLPESEEIQETVPARSVKIRRNRPIHDVNLPEIVEPPTDLIGSDDDFTDYSSNLSNEEELPIPVSGSVDIVSDGE